jgi:phosphatidylserine/phosphatidylglycerophosphate/cardiolipin synthase-like enzyme
MRHLERRLLWRRRMTRASWLLISSLAFVACAEPDAAEPDATADPGGKADGAAAATTSHVGDAVIAALDATAPGERGRTWSVSGTNRLASGWLVQSPPAAHWGQPAAALTLPALCTSGARCDLDFGLATCAVDADCGARGRCAALGATRKAAGQAAQRRCVGHSDVALLDELHGLITSARATVDLTSLQPPDGRFEAALRNAITWLGASGRTVSVRLLFGAFPVQGAVDARAVLARLTRDLPATAKVTVSVGNYRSSNLPPSWNHSKIVAVDGATALVGGHNLWTKHYLDGEPVHDLSMRVAGPAARDGHRFADLQWRWTCANRSWVTRLTGSVAAFTWSRGAVTDRCPGDSVLPAPTAGTGATTVIAAGRLALIDPDDATNPADLAQVAMVEAAERSVRISQQDLGPVQLPVLGIPLGGWNQELLDALGAAILRGVDVKVVVSSPEARVGGLGPSEAPYANGWSLAEVADEITAAAAAQPGAPAGAALQTLVCSKLQVAPIRFSADDAFTSGGVPGNHAKLLMVDDAAFYIGSQNLYPAGLTEFGYIVDSATAAATVRDTYWAPLWQHSARLAVCR